MLQQKFLKENRSYSYKIQEIKNVKKKRKKLMKSAVIF